MHAQTLIAASLCLVKAGLTGLSGAATTFSTGVTKIYAIAGKAFSRAAFAAAATPVTDGVTGLAITLKAGFGTVVLWCLDSAGNIKVVQGSTEALDAANNFTFAAPQFPILPDTLTAFAYSVHKGSAGATPLVGTWTFGVSNWNATGMSHAAVDLITIPARPQVS